MLRAPIAIFRFLMPDHSICASYVSNGGTKCGASSIWLLPER